MSGRPSIVQCKLGALWHRLTPPCQPVRPHRPTSGTGELPVPHPRPGPLCRPRSLSGRHSATPSAVRCKGIRLSKSSSNADNDCCLSALKTVAALQSLAKTSSTANRADSSDGSFNTRHARRAAAEGARATHTIRGSARARARAGAGTIIAVAARARPPGATRPRRPSRRRRRRRPRRARHLPTIPAASPTRSVFSSQTRELFDDEDQFGDGRSARATLRCRRTMTSVMTRRILGRCRARDVQLPPRDRVWLWKTCFIEATVVHDVDEDGAAKQAGLVADVLVVSVNGRPQEASCTTRSSRCSGRRTDR